MSIVVLDVLIVNCAYIFFLSSLCSTKLVQFNLLFRSLPCDFEISMLYVDDVSTYPSVCIGEDIPDSGFSPSNPRVLM